jgi:hypothetical protein
MGCPCRNPIYEPRVRFGGGVRCEPDQVHHLGAIAATWLVLDVARFAFAA